MESSLTLYICVLKYIPDPFPDLNYETIISSKSFFKSAIPEKALFLPIVPLAATIAGLGFSCGGVGIL